MDAITTPLIPDMRKPRCAWCGTDPLYCTYHDQEWGVPVHEDRKIFEFLILEGFQAGLSWITVLRNRESFRKAFTGFDPQKVACFGARGIRCLLQNPAIIRNRLKIEAAIHNARRFPEVQEAFGTFDRYIWQFTGYRTLRDPRGVQARRIPVSSPESDAMSKDLKSLGFRFVGTTICYAHMQATGVVDDHTEGCRKYVERQ